MSLDSPTTNSDSAQNNRSKSDQESREINTQTSVTSSIGGPKPSDNGGSNSNTSNPQKDWWDKAKPFVEIAGVVLLALYTLFTILMFFANKKAADAAASAADTASRTLSQITKGGNDTHELAVQAKNQADRILTEATATNALAEQAKRQADIAQEAMRANTDSARQDRRPWVGLQSLQCNQCKITGDNFDIGDLSALLVNTGKTPAVDMIVDSAISSRKASDPIPTYDMIETEHERLDSIESRTPPPNLPPDIADQIAKDLIVTEREFTLSKEVLAPNAVRGITIARGVRTNRNKTLPTVDQAVVYGLGEIIYYDTSRTVRYTTMFCLMSESGNTFRYCPSGNDMN